MTGALAAIVAAGIFLPHVLRLQRAHPLTAIALWSSSLALRALADLLAVILLLLFMPRTGVFTAATHWCARVGGDAIRVEGHAIGAFALLLPGAALGVALIYLFHRTIRDARRAHHLLEHDALCAGPRESLIVGGPDVIFAVAGLVRPRIIVSAGALASLDDDELAAALDHERAHIVRGHRFIMLVGVASAALGSAVPGTRRALRELAFHLERDADRWALRRRNDRLALASAICKAATAEPMTIAGLGGSGVSERLRELIAEGPRCPRAPATAALNALATAMVIATLALAAAVPTAALAGAGSDPHRGHHMHHCEHS